jgi:hypothetical protein
VNSAQHIEAVIGSSRGATRGTEAGPVQRREEERDQAEQLGEQVIEADGFWRRDRAPPREGVGQDVRPEMCRGATGAPGHAPPPGRL